MRATTAIKLMVYQRTDDAGAYRQILDWGPMT